MGYPAASGAMRPREPGAPARFAAGRRQEVPAATFVRPASFCC
ncbi:MAG: hypothetical protein QOD73_1692 [Solirubrobacteraceae bacterium]|jgi:hypothetical protein|nr:hypothetical protein [Solirubrobacteraceae bacterium]